MVLALNAYSADETPTQAAAKPGDQVSESLKRLAVSIQRRQLTNGLRVVLNVDRSSPTVAICVTYDVGARNEQPGRTGFAHLFEHMMFQGSRNLEKGDHFTLITGHAGSLNGTTSSDRTNYFEALPSSSLELGLWLEADRMKTLAVNQENFENQRKVVQEEYRMRVSNAPYAVGRLELQELVFKGYFAYAHPAIGSMEDLDHAKLEWIRKFHQSYYAPNNAVLTVAGDFDTDFAMNVIQRSFGDAEPSDIPDYAPGALPEQTSERRLSLEDSNAKTPGVYYGFAIPPFRTDDHYALEVASMILAYGDTSRLYQRLVRERGVAQRVASWTHDNRGPDQFVVFSVLSENAEMSQVTQVMDEELQRLATQGPSASDLEKALNRLKHLFVFNLESNMDRARQLGEYELFWGDARLLTRELDHYLAVTPERIQAAAQKYLTPARRSVVEVHPANPKQSNPTPGAAAQ